VNAVTNTGETVPATSRKQRAAATRRRILDSALTAFSQRGYSATTMDAIAGDAGVAVQTVYFSFRTKSELLQAVFEYVVLGPDQTPPHLMPWWPRPDDGNDITTAVTRFVDGTMELLARAAPLVWAVVGDDGARERYEHNEQLRRYGYGELVNVLTGKHPLRDALTSRQARDILLVLTGPQLFVQFSRDLGWSTDQIAAWITSCILHQLFAAP
jgi:AcrR family transcriptional regulator